MLSQFLTAEESRQQRELIVAKRRELPIYQHRNQIIELIRSNQVISRFICPGLTLPLADLFCL